jgi:hypothetical protein
LFILGIGQSSIASECKKWKFEKKLGWWSKKPVKRSVCADHVNPIAEGAFNSKTFFLLKQQVLTKCMNQYLECKLDKERTAHGNQFYVDGVFGMAEIMKPGYGYEACATGFKAKRVCTD